jgi:predicted RNase H-like HicB family nuclease
VIDTSELKLETRGGQRIPIEVSWTPSAWNPAEPIHPLGYCFDAILTEAEEGGYVATVAQLHGVVSEGDEMESAIRNLIEAFQATVETYKAEKMPIPWNPVEPRGPQERIRRVAVYHA